MGRDDVNPAFIPALIRIVHATTHKPSIVYPNSGESCDAHTKQWSGAHSTRDFAADAHEWRSLGATIIGGCCRGGAETIAAIKDAMFNAESG